MHHVVLEYELFEQCEGNENLGGQGAMSAHHARDRRKSERSIEKRWLGRGFKTVPAQS